MITAPTNLTWPAKAVAAATAATQQSSNLGISEIFYSTAPVDRHLDEKEEEEEAVTGTHVISTQTHRRLRTGLENEMSEGDATNCTNGARRPGRTRPAALDGQTSSNCDEFNHYWRMPLRRRHLAAQTSGASLAQPPTASEISGASQQAAAAAAAYALAQEDKRAANKLNAELCRNFSVGHKHDSGGVFTSPNYPNPYPANLICTKLIEAPPDHYVVLEFRDQFNIEEAGTDCDNDKIEIRDGRFGYSKVLARYCGNRFPPEVRSTDEAMWLRFISDGSITHTGFKAVYRFEKQKTTKPSPPFECRFNVTAMPSLPGVVNGTDNRTGIHSGIIKNTDVPEKLMEYSKTWNVSLECIWNITVTPGWKIYLTFSSYEINKPNDCDSNFIEIYEENLTEENQTVKFCGTRTEPQQSRSNVFNIRHHAIPSASGSKFEIIYTAFREKGPAGCDTREFDCDDGTCIHETLKCDGTINCKYRYDEASEPGPCASEDVQPFFETEHMVIILIVFLTLVSGMCASIIVSCWGKIQERRRRKLEYHMRKSREASMEGQMNKVDQLYEDNNGTGGGGGGGGGGPGGGGGGPARPITSTNNQKQRLTAPIVPSENHIPQLHQQYNQKYPLDVNAFDALDADQQRQLIVSNHQRHPLMVQQQQQQQQQLQSMRAGNASDNNGSSQTYGSNSQMAAAAAGLHQQHLVGTSKSNLNASMRMMQQQHQQLSEQQDRSVSVYGTRPKDIDTYITGVGKMPQLRNMVGGGGGIYGVHPGGGNQPSIANQLSSSITCCNTLGQEYLSGGETPLIGDLMKKANTQQAGNNRLIQMAQANNQALNAMRMQQQQLSNMQQAGASSATATIPRSISAYQLSKSQLRLNQQQQQQQLLLKQHQQLQQQQQFQQHQRQQNQAAYVKSVSDAGQANKHTLPNHSLSYPHACTGSHPGDPNNPLGPNNDSPGLPPPPPPPNLSHHHHQVGRSQTSCTTLPPQLSDNKRQAFKISRLDPSQLTGDTLPDSDLIMANMPLGSMQFDDVSTESDATFGVLIDSVGNASLNLGGGGASASGLGPQMARPASMMASNHIQQQQQQHPFILSQSYKNILPPSPAIAHLSECNLVRRQRTEAMASSGGSVGRQQALLSQSSCICDCGALERANLLRQQQRALMSQQQQFAARPVQQQQRNQMLHADTRDFDLDSEEAKAMVGPPFGLASNNIMAGNNSNLIMNARLVGQAGLMDMGGQLYNGPQHYGNALPNQQPQMRFNRFRQQSSELTADDDEDDEVGGDDDRDGYLTSGTNHTLNRLAGNEDDDDEEEEEEEEEISSEMLAGLKRRADVENQKLSAKYGTLGTPRSIVRRNETELRDVDGGGGGGGMGTNQRHLSGSHTSICTCGSQAKMDANNLDDDDEDDDSPIDSRRATDRKTNKPKRLSTMDSSEDPDEKGPGEATEALGKDPAAVATKSNAVGTPKD